MSVYFSKKEIFLFEFEMAAKSPPEIDDELFDEVYGKEYTGPPGSKVHASENMSLNKGVHAGDVNDESDEEDALNDPNAVPTDFTSREAKAWVARAKATERNWKKRKEEEMICKLCGLSGHFTQGCPSTLGAKRKSAEFFQRVAARDKHVRALFTEKVIHRIERDCDCKLKMDEKFIIVSSRNQSSMTKGVDAVHQVIKDNESKNSATSNHGRSRSPNGSPNDFQLKHSDSQRSLSSPKRIAHTRATREETLTEDQMREDLRKMSRRSPQAYANDGARGRSSRSKSPVQHPFLGDSYGSYDTNIQRAGSHKIDEWDVDRHGSDLHAIHKYEISSFPNTLEELEMEFRKEVMELGRIRDKEEDEENFRHRQTMGDLRESYMKKLALLRGMHAKQWDELLQHDMQRRSHAHQHMTVSTYNAYSRSPYPEYESSAAVAAAAAGNPHFAGNNFPVDSRSRYSYSLENYPSSRLPNDSFGDYQRSRRDDFGKTFHPY